MNAHLSEPVPMLSFRDIGEAEWGTSARVMSPEDRREEGIIFRREGGWPFVNRCVDRLFNRFEKVRTAARVGFQRRDLRAKTATDTDDLGHAQKRPGHESRAMTEHYTQQPPG